MALFSKDTKDIPKLDENFRHIAFIMDGNGRWAKKRGMPREYGHKVGSATFKKICIYCCDVGFKAVTVYAFSTENWKRPKAEVDAIMAILDSYLEELKRDYGQYHNRFKFIGDLSVLTPALREKITYVETLNQEYDQILNIALNYGGRAEIVNACNTLMAAGKTSVSEEDFAAAVCAKWDGEHAFYDERLTTVEAERVLCEAELDWRKRRKVVDKVAAVVILQGYLATNPKL